ncbi:MAG: hypothetical protein KBD26_02130 [Candidatus Pacebacteria bacterium]|nr:hypothetical protein [Candidatus Paceibacterota bacterium]MBP9772610.1 hypothetical protein [Candidatus Paceibacterota bacterium]
MDQKLRQTIINAYNLGSLSEDEQNDIIERIGSLIFQGILMRVMEDMSETLQSEFEEMLDKDASPEMIIGFLRENVRDFENIAKEEAEKFQRESMSVMSQIG